MQQLFHAVLKIADHAILCGYRGQAEQDADFALGKSRLKYPHGKHNSQPSQAVDAAPTPVNYDDVAGFHAFARIVLEIASSLGIKVRWGGDWDMDGKTEDEKFRDLVHFELVD